MAKTTLPTNYVDDVLNGAMDGKRRYREIPNADGTISLEDATTYDQIGNNFGASQLNLMNDNINQSFDANKMLKTMDEVNAVTQEGYGVDALVVKQLNSSLGGVAFGVDSNGNRGYYDASGKFVNFIDGDGGFIIGVADITNFKNTNRGFIINQNTAITLSKEYDLSKYKYLQLIYNDYNYYTRTWGIGYTKTPNDSYSNCMATSNKVTVSANGNSQNTYTTKTIYLDISGVNEKGYPFVYLTSSVYSYILKLQLVNELEEI